MCGNRQIVAFPQDQSLGQGTEGMWFSKVLEFRLHDIILTQG
jgi:hypothetical protein